MHVVNHVDSPLDLNGTSVVLLFILVLAYFALLRSYSLVNITAMLELQRGLNN